MPKIPVVLPMVQVAIDDSGALTITVDQTPYPATRSLRRDDLRAVLDQITSERRRAVRVEVTEADGTTYADIAIPPDTVPDDSFAAAPAAIPAAGPDWSSLPDGLEPAKAESLTVRTIDQLAGGISGTGFQPGEPVAVTYVLARQTADETGSALLHIPPGLLSSPRYRQAELVLIGLDSKQMTHLEIQP